MQQAVSINQQCINCNNVEPGDGFQCSACGGFELHAWQEEEVAVWTEVERFAVRWLRHYGSFDAFASECEAWDAVSLLARLEGRPAWDER